MEKENSIINALKRLERSGSENSKVTKKLTDACFDVAEKIIETVKNEMEEMEGDVWVGKTSSMNLPCGYVLIFRAGYGHYLAKHGSNGFFWVDDVDKQTRVGCLEFAADIADGLLAEIADWLEARKAKNEKAIEVIENAHI